jgi:hypothetical protein
VAVCGYCKSEMTDMVSCRPDALMLGDAIFEPIRWGNETARRAPSIDFCCRDCGTPPRGVHHPGCCVEQCPACGELAVACPCFLDFEVLTTGRCVRGERPAGYPMRCRAHRFRRHHLR